MGTTGEPTVEEILASIKQVIARDNRVDAADMRRHRETDGIPGAPLDDPEMDADADDILDLSSNAQYIMDDSPDDDYEDDDAPLMGAEARSGMRDSLAALAMLSEPGAQPQIVRSGETSLESLTRELLRPALADWLDKNLPPLVERLVAEEIRRISSKK